MGAGKLVRVTTSRRGDGQGNSRNTVTVPTRRKARKTKKIPAKSFKQAYNAMLPSKFIKFDLTDISMSSDTVVNAMQYVQLDNIGQGSQLNQRLQNAVYMSYLHIRGSIQSNSATKTKQIRVMVVQEVNQGDLNTTTFANLYINNGATAVAPNGTQRDGSLNINRDFYHVIYDKRIKVQPEVYGSVILNHNIRIGRRIFYPINDSTSTIPKGGLTYLLFNLYDADNATSATTVILAGQANVYFKDYRKFS